MTIVPAGKPGGTSTGDRFVKGLGCKVVAFTVVPTDYGANGLDLTALKKLIGWAAIHGAVGLTWATTPTGTPATWTIKPFTFVWDAIHQTLRAYKTTGEIAAADIAANDVIRCIFIGG